MSDHVSVLFKTHCLVSPSTIQILDYFVLGLLGDCQFLEGTVLSANSDHHTCLSVDAKRKCKQ